MLGGTDIRLATERATFGVMEPRRGLFAGGGTTVRLPRQLAFPAAMEFLLTAEAFPAVRALELGLLNEIVEPDELLPRAFSWAERILANGPLAVRATKESVVRGMAVTLKEAYRIESELSWTRTGLRLDATAGPRTGRRLRVNGTLPWRFTLAPKDTAAFERYYPKHLQLVVANQQEIGFTRADLTKFVSTVDGKKPSYYRQAELYFASMDALKKGTATPGFKKVAGDMGNFATGGLDALIAVETR